MKTCKNCEYFTVKAKKSIGYCEQLQEKGSSGGWCELWTAKQNAKSNKNNRGKCDFCKKERHELREVEMNGEIKHYCMGCIALLCEIIPPAK